MSEGLTYKKNARVFVLNGTAESDVTDDFKVKFGTISCDNLKSISGVTLDKDSKIVVRYSATLNKDAKYGKQGNPNEVYLEYSNNPNYTSEGGDSPTGETPKDAVIVFTYKLDANKVEPDGNGTKPLKGAGFTFYKIVPGTDAGTTQESKIGSEVKGEDMTTFSWLGLDAGQYVLRETTTPAGYNTAADIEFEIVGTYDATTDNAVEYNKELRTRSNHWFLTEEQQEEYESMLNVSGNGIMGYVEIPSIKVSLPIYHGVDEGILKAAIGHIEGSSLPVGGKGSHCVISGHRGMPSAKLFTDLDQLAEGDIFMLRVLDEMLTYEVDQILIVEPDDMSSLEIDEKKDCINSHRLLVRGHRIANLEDSDEIRVTADAQQIDPVLVAPALVGILLVLLLLGTLIWKRGRRRS